MTSEADTGYVFEPKDLKQLVLLPVASDWWDVGLQLDIPKHTLSTIQVSHMGGPKGPQRCLGDALDWWLKNTSDPSYEKLEKALRDSENGEGAKKLSELSAPGTKFEPKDLKQLVLLPVASDWWDVGLQLDIPKHTLSTIQASHMGHPKGPQRCLGDALDWWLKNTANPTYEKLKTALTDTENGDVVKKLSEKFGDADLEAREAALRERGDNQEMETDGGEERPEGRVSPPISEAAHDGLKQKKDAKSRARPPVTDFSEQRGISRPTWEERTLD